MLSVLALHVGKAGRRTLGRNSSSANQFSFARCLNVAIPTPFCCDLIERPKVNTALYALLLSVKLGFLRSTRHMHAGSLVRDTQGYVVVCTECFWWIMVRKGVCLP